MNQIRVKELKEARLQETSKNNPAEDQVRRITYYETILDSLEAALKESHGFL